VLERKPSKKRIFICRLERKPVKAEFEFVGLKESIAFGICKLERKPVRAKFRIYVLERKPCKEKKKEEVGHFVFL